MSGIGVNLRVTGHRNQGGRKYMEDMFSVAYQQSVDLKDLEYAFFGIFDGHGGPQAAAFAKEHLLDAIVCHRGFWSDNDEDVLRAIRDGYIATHYAMWRDVDKWPKTTTGLPSTSGTTATVAFIMKGKIYVGHVGDTAIVLGYQEEGEPGWKPLVLTEEHKPDKREEIARIRQAGGKVVYKSGIPRVVWNRPRLGHQGPVRRSTHIDEIPFLAVARSLGDFWSYNSQLDQFVVSPEPDVAVFPVDITRHRCLVFGTDGLWNMLNPERAISVVHATELHNEKQNSEWVNPSKSLVDKALEQWLCTKMRADNTSVVTLMLDPPGPPRAQVLMNQKLVRWNSHLAPPDSEDVFSKDKTDIPREGGMAIFTRYPKVLNNKSNLPTNSECIDIDHEQVISEDKKENIIEQKTSVVEKLNNDKFEPVCQNSFERKSLGTNIRINNEDVSQSPLKRRTRSEDKLATEEGGSDAENESIMWSHDWAGEGKKRRLSLEKKSGKSGACRCSAITPITGKVHVLTKTRSLEETTRMLRSDTLAAMPMKTLRSRNVNLRRQYQKNNSFLGPGSSMKMHSEEVKVRSGRMGGLRSRRTCAKYKKTSAQVSTTKQIPLWSGQARTSQSHGNKSFLHK